MSSCAYKDCFTVRNSCSTITFFNLPTDPKRREEWIRNCGPDNKKLQDLDEKSKRFLCDKHFDEKYMRRQFHRVTLHPSAVPLKYGEQSKTQTVIECPNMSQDMKNEMISEEDDEVNTNLNQVQELFVLNVVRNDSSEQPLKIKDHSTQKLSPKILNKNAKSATKKRRYLMPPRGLVKKLKIVDGQFVSQINESSLINDVNNEHDSTLNEQEVKVIEMSEGSSQTDLVEMNEKSVQIEPEMTPSNDATTQTDQVAEENKTEKPETSVPKIDDEDSYFCVKVIAEAMKRLSPKKKAEAKLHMISYMFGLENSL